MWLSLRNFKKNKLIVTESTREEAKHIFSEVNGFVNKIQY